MNTQLQNTSTAKSKSAAQASCKTMSVKAKKPLPEKTKQGLDELRALSEEANRIRVEYALAGGVMPSVNTVLLCMYEDQTGCKDFRTFLAWKQAGYAVKKGEKAFRLWGQPVKKGNTEALPADAPEGTMSGKEKHFFPTCCVFNESQVQLIEAPEDDNNEEDASTQTEENKENSEGETMQENPEINTEAEAAPSAFVRSNYSEHQEARRDRYEERAAKAAKSSTAYYEQSRSLVECIPLGQPILVDHYSARDHRRRLDKSWSAMGKSVELSKKADKLASKAESVGTAGIASDDPEAVQKLKARLEDLETAQEKMKAANKLVRKGDLQGVIKLGFSEKNAEELFKPNCFGELGFPSYSLQNNNAEIRRTKQRLAAIQKIHTSKPFEYEDENFRVYVDDGRVRVSFKFGKPSPETCKIMSKEYAFKWSRFSVEWVRKCTPNALASAPRLVARLKALDSIY